MMSDGGWANATGRTSGMVNTAMGMAGSALEITSNMVSGAGKAAYGTATGRRDMAEEGKKKMFGTE